jgi:hypothetical protein
MSDSPANATDLILQVSRDPENRLNGTVRTAGEAETHTFSGTLELMRVFEDLVPGAWSVPKPSGTLGH